MSTVRNNLKKRYIICQRQLNLCSTRQSRWRHQFACTTPTTRRVWLWQTSTSTRSTQPHGSGPHSRSTNVSCLVWSSGNLSHTARTRLLQSRSPDSTSCARRPTSRWRCDRRSGQPVSSPGTTDDVCGVTPSSQQHWPRVSQSVAAWATTAVTWPYASQRCTGNGKFAKSAFNSVTLKRAILNLCWLRPKCHQLGVSGDIFLKHLVL